VSWPRIEPSTTWIQVYTCRHTCSGLYFHDWASRDEIACGNVGTAPRLLNLWTMRWSCMVMITPRPLYHRRQGVPQSRSGRYGEHENLFPCQESNLKFPFCIAQCFSTARPRPVRGPSICWDRALVLYKNIIKQRSHKKVAKHLSSLWVSQCVGWFSYRIPFKKKMVPTTLSRTVYRNHLSVSSWTCCSSYGAICSGVTTESQ
jgi:hypothetical protein